MPRGIRKTAPMRADHGNVKGLGQAVTTEVSHGNSRFKHTTVANPITVGEVLLDLAEECSALARKMKDHGTGSVVQADEKFGFIELLQRVAKTIHDVTEKAKK